MQTKRKSLKPAMSDCYADLEKREVKLQGTLADVYAAHAADVREIVTAAFNAVAVDGKAQAAKLHKAISRGEAAQLERDAAEAAALFEGQEPFTTDSFDQLNRLEALETRLTVSALKTAAQTRDKVKEHLSGYIEDCIAAYWNYYSIVTSREMADLVQAITDNPARPIEQTVYNNAVSAARKATELVKHDMIRGETAEKAAKDAAEYVERKDKNDSNSLMYTEGTRATIEAAEEALEPYITHFYSVIADENACDLCKDIADEQEADPVPVEELISGENAPPFHPYCRCGIEVIWND